LVQKEPGRSRGGAQIRIEIRAGASEVTVLLTRNGEARRRAIVAETRGGDFTLDFTIEPGAIVGPGGDRQSGDPLWDTALRPMGAMLTAFIAVVRGGPFDTRLSPAHGLAAAALADAIRPRYVSDQAGWLKGRQTSTDADTLYARAEAVTWRSDRFNPLRFGDTS